MKSILIVLVLFLSAALAVGVFWFQQSQSIQTDIAASSGTKVLPALLDDCNVRYLHEDQCAYPPPVPDLEKYLTRQVTTLLEKHNLTALRDLRESVRPDLLSPYVPAAPPLTTDVLTVPEIVGKVSYATRINYRLIFALLAIQNPDAFAGKTNFTDVFGREQRGFGEQYTAVSGDISEILRTELESPTRFIKVGKQDYPLDESMNAGSRAVYVYLSMHLSDPKRFETIADIYNTRNQNSLWAVWQRLYGEPAAGYQGIIKEKLKLGGSVPSPISPVLPAAGGTPPGGVIERL